MSDAAIDALLLSQVSGSWQKVAMVIGRALCRTDLGKGCT